jgi:hypothetical protein
LQRALELFGPSKQKEMGVNVRIMIGMHVSSEVKRQLANAAQVRNTSCFLHTTDFYIFVVALLEGGGCLNKLNGLPRESVRLTFICDLLFLFLLLLGVMILDAAIPVTFCTITFRWVVLQQGPAPVLW